MISMLKFRFLMYITRGTSLDSLALGNAWQKERADNIKSFISNLINPRVITAQILDPLMFSYLILKLVTVVSVITRLETSPEDGQHELSSMPALAVLLHVQFLDQLGVLDIPQQLPG
jgi:hypothetical protein